MFQLTLNLPTFTKCAKIYNLLLPIIKCVEDAKKNAESQDNIVMS